MNEIERVVALFAALEAGEVVATLEMVDPDVEWSPIALSDFGTVRGREAVGTWFEESGSQPARVHVEVDDVFRVGDWVVALGTADDPRGGLGEVSPVGWALRVADGLVTVARGFDSWSSALEEAGAWTHPGTGPIDARPASMKAPRGARRVSSGQRHPHRAPSLPSVGGVA